MPEWEEELHPTNNMYKPAHGKKGWIHICMFVTGVLAKTLKENPPSWFFSATTSLISLPD